MLLRKIIFAPFSLLYLIVTSVRNFLYTRNSLTSTAFTLPVLSVGNLKVGGTGKTPHTEYLLRLLSEQYPVAVLSRGYGRKTTGFILADAKVSPDIIGDEPFQYYAKFGNKITVAVGEDRVLAIEKVLQHNASLEAIVLDDAFQHRRVKPGLNILLTEFAYPFYEDFPLPSGWLRESRYGAARADMIIVTKCPEAIEQEDRRKIKEKITYYSGEKPVYFTSYQYEKPQWITQNKATMDTPILAFAGIADPLPFFAALKKKYTVFKTISFPDHYSYIQADFEKLVKEAEVLNAMLVTTEKDAVKIRAFIKNTTVAGFYIPVTVRFLDDEAAFVKMISNFMTKKSFQ